PDLYTLALHDALPISDTIIIDAELPDMSGIDACRLLHSDPRIGHTVPTLILAPNKPTPEQRVAALRAGVCDFVLYPPDPEGLLRSGEHTSELQSRGHL